MTIKVELDVFSGRPNPSWTLTPEESQDLLKEIQSLPNTDIKADLAEEGLGYRGVLLTIQSDSKASESDFTSFRICQGLVNATNNKSNVDFRDVNELEKSLLEQAKQKGFKELVESIQK